MKLKIVPSFIAAGILLLPTLMVAQDSQPSLTDIAKQKSTTAKAKKVITDDDMPSTSAPAPSAQASATPGASAGSGAASSSAGTTDSKPAGDAPAKTGTAVDTKAAAPAAKLVELQKELDDVNHDEALLNKKLDQLQQKIDNSSDPFRKKLYQDTIDNQQTTLSEFHKRRAELEQQIADEKAKPKS